MDLKRTLGATVRQRRLELGLSQVELAERMGGETQQADVSRIERGRLPWARPELLTSLAAALELSALELITLSGWMTPEELEQYRSEHAGDAGLTHEPHTPPAHPHAPITPATRAERPLIVIGQDDFEDDTWIRRTFPSERYRVMTTFDGTTLLDTLLATAPAVVVVHQALPDLDLDRLEAATREHGLDTAVIVIGQQPTIPTAFHFVQAPATRGAIQSILVAIGID